MLNFLVGLFGNLLAAELGAWCPKAAQRIISYAAKSVPPPIQQRMLEEWSAVLDDTSGDWSKLVIAISLYWKRSEIADECEGTKDTSMPSVSFISAVLTETEEAVLNLIE